MWSRLSFRTKGSPVNDTQTIVRTGRKFDQVLRGAREVFLRDGFGGASMDDIARQARVSKATVYSYFPDKRHLFVEILTAECNRMADQTLNAIDEDAPIKDVLCFAAGQLVRFLVSDFAQRVFRICMAEADRFPELGRAYYNCGPRMGRARMVEFFQTAIDRGDLKIDDLPLAAEQFSELCKTRLWTLAAFGIQSDFTDAEIDEVVEAAGNTFLARYGRKA